MNQNVVPILSQVTDNLLFLNKPKKENIYTKICTGGVILGTLAYEAEMLPNELLHPVTSKVMSSDYQSLNLFLILL